MEELADEVQRQYSSGKQIGIELIAFSHDEDYKVRMRKLLDKLYCPVSFHGPYIGVEATASKGTKEYASLMDSYRYVFQLAAEHNVRHIVFHYTQKGFSSENVLDARKQSYENISELLEMASRYNVNMLIENLAFISQTVPLYDNKEYQQLFSDFPNALSIIDVGHANVNGTDLKLLLEKIGTKVKAYHLHNNDGKRDLHNRIGEGTFDFLAFGNLYRTYTLDADLVLEYEPHTKTTIDQLNQDIQFVENQIENQNLNANVIIN